MASTTPTTPAEVEQTASDFFAAYAASTRPAVTVLARTPRRALKALIAIHRLPRLDIAPGRGVEGDGLRAGLRMPFASRTVLGGARAALAIPQTAESYVQGSNRSKHTLRRKIRYSEKAGVTWRRIEDTEERAALSSIAARHERSHPMAAYRNANPLVDGLERFSLWFAAFGSDGEPLLLSVIPHEGQFAVLRYFRQLRDDQTASDARYLMTKVLVAELAAEGVRYLIDEASPQWLGGGVRHFQRMVGFRLFRIRLH